MPRLVPIKADKLIRVLQKIGFSKVRQRGSHLILKHEDGRETVIPIHRGEEIGRGLLRKILRDINLSVEDLNRLR